MKRLGYGFTFKELILLSFVGLRGAVGLALALIVHSNPKGDQSTKDLTLFATSSVAFLTIVVNGTAAEYLIKYLGLNEESLFKKRIMSNLLEKLETDVNNHI